MTRRTTTTRTSEIEQMFDHYQRLLAPDMPVPVCEHRFAPPRKWRFDRAWLDQRVAVELDGGQWMPGGGRHNRDSDREKLNEAAARGWRVLRFSGEMLEHNPQRCLEQLRRALVESTER
jgi:very-short-patch-repair endonuclease